VAYIVPFLFVYSPTLIMIGDPVHIVVDFVTAVAGIWLMSMGFVGYSMRRIGWLDRAAYIVVGACLLTPIALFEHAIFVNVIGAILGGLLIAREYMIRGRARQGALQAGTAAGRD
jgi:TRAP-type uncharacterized transport system fused permease subunit